MKWNLDQFFKVLKEFRSFLQTEKFLKYFVLTPLYFSWLPILTWHYENLKLRYLAYHSLLFSVLFFILLVFAEVLSWIPMLGEYFSNGFHLIAILSYLGISAFCIYLEVNQKKVEIPLISNYVQWFESFIEEDSRKSAHSSIG